MKRFFLAVALLLLTVQAEVINEPVSKDLLKESIPIVDIRTPGEWKETGLLKGAIPIMFFNERGGYDVDTFLKALNAQVDTAKPFALICRSGSRTGMVSKFLSDTYHYKVVNLQGGMLQAKRLALPVTPYGGQ